MNKKNTFIPKSSIYQLLGILCIKPELLNNHKIEIEREHFGDIFYQIIFTSIQNMYLTNPLISKITAIDIDNYINNNKKAKEIYELNNGYQYVVSAIENANVDLFEYAYDIIKKCAFLREFQKLGFNIDDLNINDENINDLSKITIDEILDKYSVSILELQSKWMSQSRYTFSKASDGIDNLFNKLSEKPDFGYPFFNKYYNAVFRGMRTGTLLIRSANSGVGKTRLALADLVSVACDEYYDLETNQWRYNGKAHPATFIFTEGSEQEIQVCILAIISGVPANIITSSHYTPEVYERLMRAKEVFKRTQINLYGIEDFAISDIEQFIRDEAILYKSQYIFFDYIQMTPRLAKGVQESYGLGLREDQILLNFLTKLKALAEKYNVYISTATQLNRNSDDRSKRNASAITGGSAVIFKGDIGIQVYNLDKNDLLEVQALSQQVGIEPNCVHVVYKNRSGVSQILIYTYLDKSNVREKIAFITDSNYRPILNIQPIDIVFKGDTDNK